eukprot:PhM_4_TR13925/c2_g1_i1/m.100619
MTPSGRGGTGCDTNRASCKISSASKTTRASVGRIVSSVRPTCSSAMHAHATVGTFGRGSADAALSSTTALRMLWSWSETRSGRWSIAKRSRYLDTSTHRSSSPPCGTRSVSRASASCSLSKPVMTGCARRRSVWGVTYGGPRGVMPKTSRLAAVRGRDNASRRCAGVRRSRPMPSLLCKGPFIVSVPSSSSSSSSSSKTNWWFSSLPRDALVLLLLLLLFAAGFFILSLLRRDRTESRDENAGCFRFTAAPRTTCALSRSPPPLLLSSSGSSSSSPAAPIVSGAIGELHRLPLSLLLLLFVPSFTWW